jgi:glycosyltransferase involved in cell wall biosynthesis
MHSTADLKKRTIVCIPAYNEADNIARVVAEFIAQGYGKIVVGIDPGTNDETRSSAEASGALCVTSPSKGYDGTLLAAYHHALSGKDAEKYDFLLCADAGGKYDYSSFDGLFVPLEKGADMVLGVRGDLVKSMLWHQKLGTQIVLFPMRFLRRTDPIRDISSVRLMTVAHFLALKLQGKKFSLPMETIVKSVALGSNILQVPVIMAQRVGSVSKVSGSVKNSAWAAVDLTSAYRFFRYKTSPVPGPEQYVKNNVKELS